MSTVLITGATGRTGRRIIGKLKDRGLSVRALVRRPEAVAELAPLGVTDCVLGTLEDSQAVQAAMAGVEQVLHVCPPMHPQEDAIAARAIDAAMRTGVRRFLLYSVLHPVIDVPHHRRKLLAEAKLIDSGMPYVILQPSRYMQHHNAIWPEVLSTGRHVMPFSTESRFSLVDLDDVAEVAARILMEPGHDFATYQLAGPEALSMQDCAACIAGLLGRPVVASERSEDEVRHAAVEARMPEARIENMTIMNRHYTAHGLVGNAGVLRWLLGREPTHFEGFVRRELMGPRQG